MAMYRGKCEFAADFLRLLVGGGEDEAVAPYDPAIMEAIQKQWCDGK